MRKKSRDTRRMQDTESIYKAVQRFHDDNGHYPCFSSGDPQYVYITTSSNAGNNCLVRDLQGYLNSVPVDPGGPLSAAIPYEYQRDTDGQAFYIRMALERCDYEPDVNCPLSGSCRVNGLPTCGFYAYCRVVPYMLGGTGCGYEYILGDSVN